MDYLRGWRALKADPDRWSKIGVASLILLSAMCIPIVGQIVLLGWCTLMMRRAVSGFDTPLPRLEFDFDYLTKLLSVGVKGFLAQLLWSLPIYLVGGTGFCCVYLGAFGAAASWFGPQAQQNPDAAAMGMGAICVVAGLAFVLAVIVMILALPMQVAVIRAELSDDVQQALRINDVLGMTRMLIKEIVVGIIVMALIGMVAGLFGIVTLYLGMLPAMVALMIINSYWRAQLYQAYLAKGGVPLPIGPLEVG